MKINVRRTLITKLDQSSLGQWSANLQSFRYNRWSDQLVLWHFFVQLIVRCFIEQDLIVQLVTDFSFRPLLLLGFATTTTFLLLLCFLWLFSRSFRVLFWRLKLQKNLMELVRQIDIPMFNHRCEFSVSTFEVRFQQKKFTSDKYSQINRN